MAKFLSNFSQEFNDRNLLTKNSNGVNFIELLLQLEIHWIQTNQRATNCPNVHCSLSSFTWFRICDASPTFSGSFCGRNLPFSAASFHGCNVWNVSLFRLFERFQNNICGKTNGRVIWEAGATLQGSATASLLVMNGMNDTPCTEA